MAESIGMGKSDRAVKSDVFADRLDMLADAIDRLGNLVCEVSGSDINAAPVNTPQVRQRMSVAEVMERGPQAIGEKAEQINSLVSQLRGLLF